MFRKFVLPYAPPVIAAAVVGTLVFNELEQHAPEPIRAKLHELRPVFLLAKKSQITLREFAGDAAPQRGVFCGNERKYSAVLVLSSSAGNNATLQERKSLVRAVARACVDLEQERDLDICMGMGPRIWDAVKGLVPLGNLAHAGAALAAGSSLVTNGGGDVMIHVKADSQTACAGAVETVLKACAQQQVAWSEDHYGFAAPSQSSSKPSLAICPATVHLGASENCEIACTPNVGTSFALFQRWEDVSPNNKKKPALAITNNNHADRVFGMDENGKRLRILKNTWRTGRLGTRTSPEDRAGMLFVAYSVNPKIFEYMLDRMAGKRGGNGVEDSVLATHKISRTQLFFVPSRAQIQSLI